MPKAQKTVRPTPSLKRPPKAPKSNLASKPKPTKELDPRKKPKESKLQLEANLKPKHVKQETEPKTFKIVVGTYEKLLYGLEASFEESKDASDNNNDNEKSPGQLQLKTVFIFPAHVACIKTVSASPVSGKWLATGSADEIIKVWDLHRRKEVGGLMHHTGSITHLTFPSRSHLLSASEDGSLCLFHTRDWAVLRSMKGHKGRVNNIAVHPSSKLALSVGQDKTLRMWDLMRGKGAASTKLGKEGEVVRWSGSGTRFVVQNGSGFTIHNLKMAPLCSMTHPSRIHDVKFFHSNSQNIEYILVAAEDKKVTIYELPMKDEESVDQLKVVGQLIGHQNRVKAVDLIAIRIPPYERPQSRTYATTISSDGFVRIYDLDEFVEKTLLKNQVDDECVILEPIARFDTNGSRLTCLTLANGEMVGSGIKAGVKRKRDEKDSDIESASDAESPDVDSDEEEEEK